MAGWGGLGGCSWIRRALQGEQDGGAQAGPGQERVLTSINLTQDSVNNTRETQAPGIKGPLVSKGGGVESCIVCMAGRAGTEVMPDPPPRPPPSQGTSSSSRRRTSWRKLLYKYVSKTSWALDSSGIEVEDWLFREGGGTGCGRGGALGRLREKEKRGQNIESKPYWMDRQGQETKV